MKKSLLFFIVSVTMTIAYIDLVDSFKQIDKIMTKVMRFDNTVKTKVKNNDDMCSRIQK